MNDYKSHCHFFAVSLLISLNIEDRLTEFTETEAATVSSHFFFFILTFLPDKSKTGEETRKEMTMTYLLSMIFVFFPMCTLGLYNQY